MKSLSMETFPLIVRIAAKTSVAPKELERFIKFATVGAIGAVVDFIVLNIMKILFERMSLGVGWHIGLDPNQIQLIAANTISFSTAVISNFTWNRLWTFPESRDKPIVPQLLQFATVNVLGLIINTFILVAMDHYLFSQFFDHRLSYNLAKAFAIGVVLFWNFGINRIWTYRGIE
ncbi:MAG TPA: GtrA family protein [Anaerolineae bacterium]|nr:GtrA family protein [Anaerolineae bacterium]